MKYADYLKISTEDRLEYFMSSLSLTNRTAAYYVNWDKVISNTKKVEISLNTLNYLVGKQNIYKEAKFLFTEQPNLLEAIPVLLAIRDTSFVVLEKDGAELENYVLDFNNPNLNNLDSYLDFMTDSGLFNFLQNNINRSLVDYVFGVEVGLDSNARKNRSGTTMESFVEQYIIDVCTKMNFDYIPQATAQSIKEQWGVEVAVDKSKRKFDIAVYDKFKNKLYLVETNYYGGGGSKLKSVAGEFSTLNDLIATSKSDVRFVWVTDGQGWVTAKIPLGEAFEKIENIFNLRMLADDYLYDLMS